MKYLILIVIIYGIYKFTKPKKTLDTSKMDQINKEEEEEGFTDYEEVD